MLVPISWLKDFVKVDLNTQELADKLVSCGFEIEEIKNQRDDIFNVVACKINNIIEHPNANKLRICDVNIGSDATIQIVTAATNVGMGDVVPVALDGAKLFSGQIINKGELRGVMSYGMFCGAEELNIDKNTLIESEREGVYHFSNSVIAGTDVNDILGYTDVILDVAVTANRPDCNSIIGIAKEVAAVTSQRVIMPKISFDTKKVSKKITITNDSQELCSRYMGRVVDNLVITKSPAIIASRLRSVGIRPINNIVDITNYILTEVGQPMHAFDYDKICGSNINIRLGNNEKVIALDNKTYTVDDTMLVIADKNVPMAIAGIMGGALSAISNDTKCIVFESARFARDNVRRSSRKLNLRSDSSARYEKGVDFYSQQLGMERALTLISQYGWGDISEDVVESYPVKRQEQKLEVKTEEINKILGIKVDSNIMVNILNSLAIETKLQNETLFITVPGHREDIVGVNDITEEIIRIYGYSHITPKLMENAKPLKGGRTKEQSTMDKIKNILVGKGLSEIVTYSFISPKASDMLHLRQDNPLRQGIKITNPIGEDFSVMRTTLAHSMLSTLSTNYLRSNKEVQLFEVAKTYIPKSLPLTEYPIENNYLAIGLLNPKCDFYTLKGIVVDILDALAVNATFSAAKVDFLHPTRTAQIIDDKNVMIGYIGEVDTDVATEYGIDKRVYLAELNVDYVVSNTKLQRPFVAIPKYPAIERDLALITDANISASKLLDTIKKVKDETLQDYYVFDIYSGDQVAQGQKSVAIKLIYRHNERTLTDIEVANSVKEVLGILYKELSVKLR